MDTANDYSHAFAIQSLESGRCILLGSGLFLGREGLGQVANGSAYDEDHGGYKGFQAFTLYQRPQHPSNEPGHEEIDDGRYDDGEEGVEGAGTDEVGGSGHIGHGNVTYDTGSFEQADDLALIDGNHRLDHLRQYDPYESLAGRVAQGQAGLGLASVNALDGRAQHFTDIGRRVHAKGDNGHHYARGFQRSHDHIVHEHQEHQYRCPAHDVYIDLGNLLQPGVTVHAHPTDDGAQDGAQNNGAERNE